MIVGGNLELKGGIVGVGQGYVTSVSHCYNVGHVDGAPLMGTCPIYIHDQYAQERLNSAKMFHLKNCFTATYDENQSLPYGTEKTKKEFRSGEVSYLLNDGNTTNPIWTQTLNVDPYPVLNKNHKTVYYYSDEENEVYYYYNEVSLTVAESEFGTIVTGPCNTITGAEVKVEVTPIEGYEFKQWSNGATANPIVVKMLYDTVLVPIYQRKGPEIALVTVSKETNNNLIVWLKAKTDDIDFYTIYRQKDEYGHYEPIAQVPYNQLSVYEDTEVNPKEMPWSYKISATNINGVETAVSKPHKTIHLIRTNDPFDKKQYDLNWTSYEGITFSSYIIMRERNVNGEKVIDTLKIVSSDITRYSDTESEEGTIGYYVGIKLPKEIDPKTQFLKAESGPFALAISNIAEVETVEDVAIRTIAESNANVYSVGHTIYVNNPDCLEITVYDINGRKLVNAQKQDNFSISVKLDGVYVVTVGKQIVKIIVE